MNRFGSTILMICIATALALPAHAKGVTVDDATIDKMICDNARNVDQVLQSLIDFTKKAEASPLYGPHQLDWLATQEAYVSKAADWTKQMDGWLAAPRGVSVSKTIFYNLGEGLASPFLALLYAELGEGDKLVFKIYHKHKHLSAVQKAEYPDGFDPKPLDLNTLADRIELYRAIETSPEACRDYYTKAGQSLSEKELDETCSNTGWVLNELKRVVQEVALESNTKTLNACTAVNAPKTTSSVTDGTQKQVATSPVPDTKVPSTGAITSVR
jgi:hypothetical protein